MTALQTLPSVPSSIPPLGAISAPRQPASRKIPVHPLDQQGVRGEWFTRGIAESNCALFHASLYPVLPQLNDKIQGWLIAHHADPSMASDQSKIASLSLGVIVLAFEQRHQWRQDQTVLLWLASFIPAACAAEEST